MPHRMLALSAGAAALVAVASALAAAPSPVENSRANEYNPAAAFNQVTGERWLAWSRNSRAHPGRFHAFVRKPSGSVVRVNPPGTNAWTGGIDVALDSLVYQQVEGARSDLRFYDLSSGTRTLPPTGVNTPKWEWHPTYSHPWLLFARDDNDLRTKRVVLHNLLTGAERLLAKAVSAPHYLVAGQVNGNYAVYARCTPQCNVFLHDIALADTRLLPRPDSPSVHHQYAPSVLADGTAFVARSGHDCGANVKIVRYGSGDPSTGRVIASLASGVDFFTSHAALDQGVPRVFFDRTKCESYKSGIYSVDGS